MAVEILNNPHPSKDVRKNQPNKEFEDFENTSEDDDDNDPFEVTTDDEDYTVSSDDEVIKIKSNNAINKDTLKKMDFQENSNENISQRIQRKDDKNCPRNGKQLRNLKFNRKKLTLTDNRCAICKKVRILCI